MTRDWCDRCDQAHSPVYTAICTSPACPGRWTLCEYHAGVVRTGTVRCKCGGTIDVVAEGEVEVLWPA